MKRRNALFFYFVLFFIVSLAIVFFFRLSVSSVVESTVQSLLLPIQKTGFSFFRNTPFYTISEKGAFRVEEVNQLTEFTQREQLRKDNQALRDQFQTTEVSAPDLLTAQVVGAPKSLATDIPITYILDKGLVDGVKKDQAVVLKNNLIGKIVGVSERLSTMILLSNPRFVTSGKTVKTEAVGVIKGKDSDEITLDTVLLSEDLKTSDMVVTKGDINDKGQGIPPGLIVGKIISVDKKPSALFQTANVKSLVTFSKLSTVFIITAYPK